MNFQERLKKTVTKILETGFSDAPTLCKKFEDIFEQCFRQTQTNREKT